MPVGDPHTATQVPLAEPYPTDRLRKSPPPTSSPTHVATGMSSDRQGGVRESADAFFPKSFLHLSAVMWFTRVHLQVRVSERALPRIPHVCGGRLRKEFHAMIGFPCQGLDKLCILRNSLTRGSSPLVILPVQLLIRKHPKYLPRVSFTDSHWLLMCKMLPS